MTNVVRLEDCEIRRRKVFIAIHVFVDPDAQPRKGELVVCQFVTNGKAGEPIFFRYLGPTGRDRRGHFVKAGSPDECLELDGCLVSPGCLASGRFKILGRVIFHEQPVSVPLMVPQVLS